METSKRNTRMKLAIIIAIVLALATIYVVYKYINPERTTMFVFRNNYKAGTQLNKDMIIPVQADNSILIEGVKGDADKVFVTTKNIKQTLQSGDSLRVDVVKGTPLTPQMLTVQGGSGIEINMKPNAVAVTVGVTNITGVSRDIKLGSRVNVYSTSNNGTEITTNLILESMKVLSVQKNENGNLLGVTLEVTPDESIKLIHAVNFGNIYLGLIDIDKYELSPESVSPEEKKDEEKIEINQEPNNTVNPTEQPINETSQPNGNNINPVEENSQNTNEPNAE